MKNVMPHDRNSASGQLLSGVRTFSRASVWLLIVYWPILLVLMHMPLKPSKPKGPFQPDKVVHVLMYGALGFLICWVLWPWWNRNRQRDLTTLVKYSALAVVMVTIHGIADELTQPWTARTCDIVDLAADFIGAVLAVGLFSYLATQPRLDWVLER